MKRVLEFPMTVFVELTKKHDEQSMWGQVELKRIVSYEICDGVVEFLSKTGKIHVFKMDLVEFFEVSTL
jgi:hypothetical protein